MRLHWPEKEQEELPDLGSKRVTKEFAWLPVFCEDYIVWLEHYHLHEVYGRNVQNIYPFNCWKIQKKTVIDREANT
jgi:hypothetical protein